MLTENERNRRIEIIKTSNSMQEAAERLGISYSGALQWSAKNNVEPETKIRKEPPQKEDLRMTLYLQGKTDNEIAEGVGTTVILVRKWRYRKKLVRNEPQIKVVEEKIVHKAKSKHFPPDIRQRLGFYAMIL